MLILHPTLHRELIQIVVCWLLGWLGYFCATKSLTKLELCYYRAVCIIVLLSYGQHWTYIGKLTICHHIYIYIYILDSLFNSVFMLATRKNIGPQHWPIVREIHRSPAVPITKCQQWGMRFRGMTSSCATNGFAITCRSNHDITIIYEIHMHMYGPNCTWKKHWRTTAFKP